ncbi:DsbA family protein [Patescibacteria group bacterium]|nr:DsbA family protein [Patescibacteria group bacterium]
MSERLTKKQLKEMRRLEMLDREKASEKSSKTKIILIAIASVLFLGMFSFAVVSSKQQQTAVVTQQIKLTANEHIKGDKNAKVIIVEFSDFQCPACKFYTPQADQILKDYNGKIKLVYKEFPLPGHPNAMLAAQAAEAAALQGKFWEMHDLLFQNQDTWGAQQDPKATFISYAEKLGLDTQKFTEDMGSKAVADKIKTDQDEGNRVNLQWTPTFYVNNRLMTNSGKYEDFKKIVEQALGK